jgi:hypothetical protein
MWRRAAMAAEALRSASGSQVILLCGHRDRILDFLRTLETYARIWTTQLSPFPDPVMLLEMVRHVLLA